ncbi:MAG: tetratricopeptide repeat protein [Saprospiraceae bacterium]|nr:tetratricopeptide repeat protein [Saprospiraceae bacterium]
MNNSNNTDRIEAYVMDNMTSQEKIQFETEINNDSELLSQVNLYKLEVQALKLLERQQLQAQFETWKKEKQQDTGATVRTFKTRNYLQILSIAASFLLLVVAGMGWINTNYSNDALADSLFENPMARSRADQSSDPLAEALEAMAEKDFERAITLLNDFDGTLFATKATLKKGEAYYQKGDYEKAAATYQKIVNSPNEQPTNINEANWLLAGVYLKQGETTKATALLSELATTPNMRQQEANALLKKYQSIWHRLTW